MSRGEPAATPSALPCMTGETGTKIDRQGATVTIWTTDGRVGTITAFAPEGAGAGDLGSADIDGNAAL